MHGGSRSVVVDIVGNSGERGRVVSPTEPARSAGWQRAVKLAVRSMSQVACVVGTRPGDPVEVRIATMGLEVRGSRVQGTNGGGQ